MVAVLYNFTSYRQLSYYVTLARDLTSVRNNAGFAMIFETSTDFEAVSTGYMRYWVQEVLRETSCMRHYVVPS